MSSGFEERALAAGTALRAAFVQDDRPDHEPAGTDERGRDMSADTPTAPVQPLPPLAARRRRPAAWSAAAAVVVAGTTAGALALAAGDDPGDRLVPAGPPAVVLEGLPERPDYPLTVTLPRSLEEFAAYEGYRAFEVVQAPAESAYVVVAALDSFDGVPAADLPSDISSLLADREDVVVTDMAVRRVLDRPAHTFTLTTRPGQRARPVWCAAPGTCWFPLPTATVDVAIVPSSAGPLVVLMEADPEGRAAGAAARQQLLDGIDLR